MRSILYMYVYMYICVYPFNAESSLYQIWPYLEVVWLCPPGMAISLYLTISKEYTVFLHTALCLMVGAK